MRSRLCSGRATFCAAGRAVVSRRRAARAGFTLIEILVAMTITLLMMGAVAEMFSFVATNVKDARSSIEIAERLRSVRNRLQTDLSNATATMSPPLRPESDPGYFEVIEGFNYDAGANFAGTMPAALTTPDSRFGDLDDILMFTARSKGEPYVGKFNGGTIQSQVAEIVYFVAFDPFAMQTNTANLRPTLYRRCLLVLPNPTGWTSGRHQIGNNVPQCFLDFYDQFDISVHFEQDSMNQVWAVANTLGDLAKRENRFYHDLPANLMAVTQMGNPVSGFPWKVTPSNATYNIGALNPFQPQGGAGSASPRFGEDVVMTDLLAFDVKVWDPTAAVKFSATGGSVVVPSDPGYGAGGAVASYGAYVDLFYRNYAPPPASSTFSDVVQTKSQLTSAAAPNTHSSVYDTWSLSYEQNGRDEDSTNGADTATNGLDDDNNGIVDDLAERDTRPPYEAELRGVQVKIRAYEPDSKLVREVTVVQDFLPD